MMWTATSDGAGGLRFWNDEYVVYNQRSGNTHLLGFAAGQVLLKLQQSSLDVDSLSSTLATDWQLELDDEFKLQISLLVEDLAALSLIESA